LQGGAAMATAVLLAGLRLVAGRPVDPGDTGTAADVLAYAAGGIAARVPALRVTARAPAGEVVVPAPATTALAPAPPAPNAPGAGTRRTQTWEQEMAPPDQVVRNLLAADVDELLRDAVLAPGEIVRRGVLCGRRTGRQVWAALPPETGVHRVRDVLHGLDHERA